MAGEQQQGQQGQQQQQQQPAGANGELRAVLQRQMSGRDSETTFEAPQHDVDMESGKQAAPAAPKAESMGDILRRAGNRALGGGLPGAMAMGIQVTSLMWLRTTMNYQYRHGTSTGEAIRHLYKEGGIRRFYRGYGPAIFQGPLSRFGDTASNAGMLALLESNSSTRELPVFVKTGAASVSAGLFRIFLMPIDTTKTILQVEGAKGMSILKTKIKAGGPFVMYHGAIGAAGATMVGHYPWFATFNTLQENLPKPREDELLKKLGRNAFIGFCSSFVSDCASNSIRVVKTTKQTYSEPISYGEAVRLIMEKDGLQGLFFRGLGTRILANGAQGMLFAVLWKALQEQFFSNK
mmetsp:Transcript_14270/g.40374  ORF Transcript_14270/g.40374 Transcript_14270/m.40374 type:complete len:350 (-) Transcript_14270:213-1262(-)